MLRKSASVTKISMIAGPSESSRNNEIENDDAPYNMDPNNDCQYDGYIAHETDCRKFYRCVDIGNSTFMKHEFQCRKGFVWDQERQLCTYSWLTSGRCYAPMPDNFKPDNTTSYRPGYRPGSSSGTLILFQGCDARITLKTNDNSNMVSFMLVII